MKSEMLVAAAAARHGASHEAAAGIPCQQERMWGTTNI